MAQVAYKDKAGLPGKQLLPANARQLKDLRGVGRAFLKDFELLGVRSVADLARRDGLVLYERLNRITGVRQDPCVLDTLRCAVAQARNPELPDEQKDWWYWSRQRKRSGS